MRPLLILSVIACLIFGACGGGDETTATSSVSFPPPQAKGGSAYASVKSENRAATLCFWAHVTWPKAYSAYDKITFRIPGPGQDYVCQRSQ